MKQSCIVTQNNPQQLNAYLLGELFEVDAHPETTTRIACGAVSSLMLDMDNRATLECTRETQNTLLVARIDEEGNDSWIVNLATGNCEPIDEHDDGESE